MPDSTQNSRPASRLETPELLSLGASPHLLPSSPALLPSPQPSLDNGTLPPTLTPATTTRQSVALGALSTLWGTSSTPTVTTFEPSVPAIVTHAPSPDAQDAPLDLAASTGSVPSTATTLTNTLPPTQSAALRALNAPAFQSHAKSKSAKSSSSRTTLSSQPVVVRTYSGSRHTSRPSSSPHSPRFPPNMSAHAGQNPSALSAGLAGRTETLPSLEDFSFSAILRAVDPEIRDAIDAIAEICARSRYSLADEYDAHLPPQGEITGSGPGWAAGMGAMMGRGRVSRIGQGWTTTENTLTAVPEASSSSERLAGETKASSKKRSQSAYGSLKSVISGGSGGGKRKTTQDAPQEIETSSPKRRESSHKLQSPTWAINASSPDHPTIKLVTTPQASKQLSLDTSSTITDMIGGHGGESARRPHTAIARNAAFHRRNISTASLPASQARSGTLSSITSWLPWPRPQNMDASSSQELTNAEARLREMLMAQSNAQGKGKAPISVA